MEKSREFFLRIEEMAEDTRNPFSKCDISLLRDPQSIFRQYNQIKLSLDDKAAVYLATELLIDNVLKGSYKKLLMNGSTIRERLVNEAIQYGLMPSNVRGAANNVAP